VLRRRFLHSRGMRLAPDKVYATCASGLLRDVAFAFLLKTGRLCRQARRYDAHPFSLLFLASR